MPMDDRAREDLALIRQLMEESRGAVVERGKHLMIWGVVSAAGLLLTYGAVAGVVGVAPRWSWTVLVVAGWIASLAVGLREGRRSRVRTLGRRLLGGLWVATGVTLTLIGASGLFGGVVPDRALPGLVSAVLAAAILVTSQLTGERWLAWVAAGWWAGAAAMLFVPGSYAILAMAAMAALLLVVPGAALYARSGRASSS